jgi:hypothetical protein
MMAKFTFKKEPRETGLRSVGRPYPDTQIKLEGKRVGMIAAPSRFGGDAWQVRLVQKLEPTEADPCPWRWIFFKTTHETEADAREWLRQNATAIVSKFDLASLND